MHQLRNLPSSSRVPTRLALLGMSLAILALGALAIWSAVVTQHGTRDITRVGVQTTGHLRTMQALSLIDTQTDGFEDGFMPSLARDVVRSVRILAEARGRMERGGVAEASRLARQAEPIVRRLRADTERFLALLPRRGQELSDKASSKLAAAEENMDEATEKLQRLMNDIESDPLRLLAKRLHGVTDSSRLVNRMAFVMVPVGLIFVAACGWMLAGYRRRSESAMRDALEVTTHEARTDQLTGLANRRALLEELERRVEHGESGVLAIADLNGFKHYNDTYGHPAGDALLRRLGGKLEAACAGLGMAARLGGDEFCVLLRGGTPAHEVEALVRNGLSEVGDGFRITAACGVVAIPAEAGHASDALRTADTRMYAAKTGSRPTTEYAMSRALLRMLDERHPGLGEHVDEVADLATACAEELGLPREEVDQVRHAGELHDIGKVAIPGTILKKGGPLDKEEWAYMRRHTLIGERILAAVPAMQGVATIVRSSHERWDGTGYPDRIGGDSIAIGARVVAVADAFCAMTEDRPYATSRTREEAIAELRRCAGTQFDPAVVDAFVTALADREARPAAVAA
jgi:diguanylate cyclase (GGDEF)-like protein